MKRLVTALVILIVFLNMQICLAEEQTTEDIDSYFVDEPEQTQELHGYLEYNQQEPQQKEEDSIYLDNKVGINFTKPQKIDSSSLSIKTKKSNFHPIQDEMERVSSFSNQSYDIRPVNTSFSQQFGKFRIGTNYGSSLSSSQMAYSTSVFAKYEGKHAAFRTAILKNIDNNSDNSNSLSFTPELKLTKRLSLLDVWQTDANQINKSNDVVLRYTPHLRKYAEDVQFDLGAGQSFYEDTYIKSSIYFNTTFKL